MTIDTPATIVVLGAGPVGIETALYGRFLGYDVLLIEKAQIAEHVSRRGEELLPGPFMYFRSPLGLAALAAQDPSYEPPADDATISCAAWVERYLAPLVATDLLSGSVHEQAEIVDIELAEDSTGEESHHADLAEEESEELPPATMTVVWRNADGEETRTPAHVIVDATGPLLDEPPFAAIFERPGCYCLGPRDPGGAGMHTFEQSLSDIRELYSVLYGRPDLDLYARMKSLPR